MVKSRHFRAMGGYSSAFRVDQRMLEAPCNVRGLTDLCFMSRFSGGGMGDLGPYVGHAVTGFRNGIG